MISDKQKRYLESKRQGTRTHSRLRFVPGRPISVQLEKCGHRTREKHQRRASYPEGRNVRVVTAGGTRSSAQHASRSATSPERSLTSAPSSATASCSR
jgi:hypothetical protein